MRAECSHSNKMSSELIKNIGNKSYKSVCVYFAATAAAAAAVLK